MITYHNRTHMTAVPTELLQDTHLSVEAKGFAAILYASDDDSVKLSELARQLKTCRGKIDRYSQRACRHRLSANPKGRRR